MILKVISIGLVLAFTPNSWASGKTKSPRKPSAATVTFTFEKTSLDGSEYLRLQGKQADSLISMLPGSSNDSVIQGEIICTKEGEKTECLVATKPRN